MWFGRAYACIGVVVKKRLRGVSVVPAVNGTLVAERSAGCLFLTAECCVCSCSRSVGGISCWTIRVDLELEVGDCCSVLSRTGLDLVV